VLGLVSLTIDRLIQHEELVSARLEPDEDRREVAGDAQTAYNPRP
jgi:hypothetical protein